MRQTDRRTDIRPLQYAYLSIGLYLACYSSSRHYQVILTVDVIGQSSWSEEKDVSKAVGATSSEGFIVYVENPTNSAHN